MGRLRGSVRPVVIKTNFYGNDVSGGCGMGNQTGGTIDARGNVWGAAGGPGDDPADRACDEGSSVTTTSEAAAPEIAVKVPTFQVTRGERARTCAVPSDRASGPQRRARNATCWSAIPADPERLDEPDADSDTPRR
jgi:hypothetical protein